MMTRMKGGPGQRLLLDNGSLEDGLTWTTAHGQLLLRYHTFGTTNISKCVTRQVSIIRSMLLGVRCKPLQPVADRDGVSIKILVFGDP